MTTKKPSQNRDLWLDIELTGSLSVEDLDDPVAQTVHHSFRVFFTDDEDNEVDVGRGDIEEIPVHYDPDDEEQGAKNYDVMDALSSETFELHEAIQANLASFTDGGVRHPVYLEKLIIKPEFQGQGMGTRVLRRLMHHWSRHGGVPSHIFLMAYPIDPHASEEREAWKQRDPEGFREAKLRVQRFYERLGFKQVGRTDFMAFDLQFRIPGPPD